MVEEFVGSAGVSLLFWRIGGVGDSSVHLEVFSGVLVVLSLWFCVVGRKGELLGDFECFANNILWWKFYHFYVEE